MTQQPVTRDAAQETATPQHAEAERPAQKPLWQRPPLAWAAGFVMFWYHFIIGDDWTLAAVVAVGLTVTALLHANGTSVWWLVPAMVVVVVGLDLERASRRAGSRQRKHSDRG